MTCLASYALRYGRKKGSSKLILGVLQTARGHGKAEEDVAVVEEEGIHDGRGDDSQGLAQPARRGREDEVREMMRTNV